MNQFFQTFNSHQIESNKQILTHIATPKFDILSHIHHILMVLILAKCLDPSHMFIQMTLIPYTNNAYGNSLYQLHGNDFILLA